VVVQGNSAARNFVAMHNQQTSLSGLIKKAKWLAGVSALAASTSAMAAPPLVLNNLTPNSVIAGGTTPPTGGVQTSTGAGQGERAVWRNAGTVGGVTVDIVGIMTTATLDHHWITFNNRPGISARNQDNVQIEWHIYSAGSYVLATNSGGVPVVADVHVQFNDIDGNADGTSNERAFFEVCKGGIKWIRIDAAATTKREFGTISGNPNTFSLIGDKNYSNTPDSGVEVFYPDASVFKMGRTGNPGFLITMNSPTYSEFTTLDFECADFKPPIAVDDSKEGVPGTPTVLNILNNDSTATQNNNTPHNNTLAASEFGRSTVSLIAPPGATAAVTDAKGDVVGFTVPGEGTWAYSDTTGALTFTPDPSFKGYATTIQYTVDNALGVASNAATVTVWYPAIGVTKSSAFNDTNGDGFGQVGETIDYIYQVKAYGAEALQNVSIAETGFTGAGTLPTPAYDAGDANTDNKLDLAETWVFKASYALVAADLTSGNVANSATGKGQTAAGTTVTDTSDSSNPADGNGTGTSGPGPNNGDPTRTPLLSAPIVAANNAQAGTIFANTGSVNAYNVLGNDTLNGVTATPALVTLSVVTPASNAGVTLDAATGLVSVAPGTPAGSYTIDYKICEIGNPGNCANATASIVVTAPTPITAATDAPAPVTSAAGGSNIINALTNDRLNGVAVAIGDVNLTVTTPASNPGVILDPATGLVSVAPGTPIGTYAIDYQICEKTNPTNCATSTVTVVVGNNPIAANNDSVPAVNGATGNPNAFNAFTNDTLNGAPVVATDIDTTVTAPATPKSPGAPVPMLDTATGNVAVPAGTPAGTYIIGYQICEKAEPTNCKTAVITVVVAAAPIAATDDSTAPINSANGGSNLVNALDNDRLNGVVPAIATINLSVVTPASNAGVTLDPATGLVSVAPGTPAGNYTIAYEICEKLNPANCALANITVPVTATPITAANDTPAPVNGSLGGNDIINAFANDQLNGAPVVVSAITATITSPATPATPGASVPVLDPATGLVDVPATTPPGTYVIAYQICETANPGNCAPASITVIVTATPIVAANDSKTGVNGVSGDPAALNLFTGDMLDGVAATPANTILSIAPGSSVPSQLTFDPATGVVAVNPGTPAGTYSFDYQICETTSPANCRTATASVTVDPSPIVATNDSATGINGVTGAVAVANAFTSDTINGVAASPSNATVTVRAGTTVPAGLTFDPATGSVDVVPGTPAGSYVIDYTICETLNPTNCKDAKITVDVIVAVIGASNDTKTGVNGVSGDPAALNLFVGDTIDGVAATPSNSVLRVAPGSSVPSQLTFDPATGVVAVNPGTPAGTYTFDYQVCDIASPTNCKTATASVTVDPSPIVATNDSATGINGATGATAVANAFTSDTINGVAASPSNATVTVRAGTTVPAGLTFDPATGSVDVVPGTPVGSYVIDYTICETLNPTNCKDAKITVDVIAALIAAANDSKTGVNGVVGDPAALNLFAGDTLNGVAATPASTTLSVAPGSSVPSQLTFDPATGVVAVNPGTPAGTYSFDYQICETLNPANCKIATASVTVDPSPIVATNDSATGINGTTGATAVTNAFTSDTINGVAASPSNATVTVRAGTTVPAGLTFDPATGSVDVVPGTPAGSYVIDYTICEILNPTNCKDAKITVDVIAAPIAATHDTPPAVNGGTGNPSVTNAFTNDMLNGVPVTPATVMATVKTPATNPGVVLDPATGNVSVAPGTPAGTYVITYEICERLNPTNCATSTVTVVVDPAPIAATPDTPPAVNGATGNPSVTNAFTNDMLNGVPVTPATIMATIKTPATNPGVVMDPATGTVSVAPGTPAGPYTITYEICERLNSTNCATSTVTVVVDPAPIEATNDAPDPVPSIAGAPNIINALVNDSLNGQPVVISQVTLSVTSPASNPNVTLDPATGMVSVAPNTPAGNYTIGYQICETLNPSNCATATVAVVVQAAGITAAPDMPAPVNGSVGGDDIINAFTNDMLGGVPVEPANITATITTPATPKTPGAPVPIMDPVKGFVDVPVGTPAGSYVIEYQICENLNPANCANSSVTVVVQPPAIAAAVDAPALVRSGVGNPNAINAFTNDTLNGVAVDPALITATMLTPAANPGVMLDPVTGNVSVAADVPAGTYTIEYQICEILNPSNCAVSTVTIVVAMPISAVEGTVFTDLDSDGQIDPNDPRRSGWIVEIMHDGALVGTAITDANGNYRVEGLVSGPGYEVVFRNPENNVVYDRIEGLVLGSNTTVVDQNQPIDPSGIFYDSITRLPISGVTSVLADVNGVPLPAVCFVDPSQARQTTGASGEYRFDIVPGANAACPVGETTYRIVATPPAGYAPGSTVLPPLTGPFDPTGLPAPVRINPEVTAPTGPNPPFYLDFRLAAGDPDIINNHIALDPFLTRTPLIVTKTSIKRNASVGDIVPYEITVRNTENAQRIGVNVVDILPPGMKYVMGTSTIDGVASEPVKTDRELSWAGQVIPANGSRRYNLTLIVGAGVTGGEKVNTGVAENAAGTAISNRGTAVVSITPNAVFDCSELLGKVFEDANRNGYQDENEPGVPGVRLVTVNGQLITTDTFGRYHIACAAVPDARIGSNLVLKVDTRTLPLGWDTTTDNPRSIRLTRGKFGELNFGVAPKEESSTSMGDTPKIRTEKGE
jgi:large repetitive protein